MFIICINITGDSITLDSLVAAFASLIGVLLSGLTALIVFWWGTIVDKKKRLKGKYIELKEIEEYVFGTAENLSKAIEL